MGTADRRARERDELRQKILAAATELLLENGYESVSMRRIAEKIEYAPSTIYLYFADKNALCSAIAAEAFEILIQSLTENEAQDLPALHSIRAGMRRYVDFGLSHPNQYRWVFGTLSPDAVEHDAAINQVSMNALGFLARAIARCRAAGDFGPGDDMVDTFACWAQMHGLIVVLINDYGKYGFPWPEREAFIERSIDLILRGLRAHPEA